MDLHPSFLRASLAALLFVILAFGTDALAQQKADTTNTVTIDIRNAVVWRFENGISRLIGDVQLQQGTTTMNCDSAYIDQESNNMEAFGNVQIIQTGGTTVTSDYLKYTGNTKQAYLKGNVSLTDGKNNLWTEELNYNLGTKIGVYSQTGTLQSDATTLSSNAGTYNVRTKDARFTGDVTVTDPQYDVTSSDLGYNTESKMVRFYGPSIVISEQSELVTSSGTWDGKNEIAHFTERSSIRNGEQYIEGDNLDYNKQTGIGIAKGNVYALDTALKTTLYCGHARYNEITRQMWATLNPVMKKATEKDSIYMRADTFYVAPVKKAGDTLVADSASRQRVAVGKGISELKRIPADTTTATDTAVQRYFVGYHNVLVFADSLQAVGDSISYSQADSIMRLMSGPIAWSRQSQITGDTILLFLSNNQLQKIFIPNNAFVVSRSGPEKANLYDQVQGRTLTGYFDSSSLREMVVFPNAEAIYYATDESGAYLGANQASSERMRVYFESKEISRIRLEQDVKQTMTPMQQVNIPTMRLSRFIWEPSRRPASAQDLFLFRTPVKEPTEDKTQETEKPAPKKQQTKSKRKK
ncbi:MAG: hypothetical protein EOP49_02600 [Sphingobacteriales bacterium]|nr:MAG: hypothetical protein EOP49_02600 [Sphingobacteriales bacterium]